MARNRYTIGGYEVVMSDAAAERWNNGQATLYDLDSSRVVVPLANGDTRKITLRRAVSERYGGPRRRKLIGRPAILKEVG